MVTMVARVTPAPGVGIRDLPALDPGAGIAGGTVLPTWIAGGALEIVTWNTGEASDLRRYGNRSHAEAQFYEFMRDRDFTSIEIEISHSPCTACADMLAGLLNSMKARAASVLRGPNRRVGKRILVGSATDTARPIPATLRWGTLFETPPQATTPQSLRQLQAAGWRMAAPRTAIPNDAGTPAITLL
ncbi:MAG: hypothetical protein ISP49_04525 [Reyranella sp.]|nr:hypothetical protein [Reyranella sp.]MBL6650834.1 hypothetical protein [Reyranella sp.]